MEALFYVAILFAIIIFLSLFTYFVPIGLWITAYFAGVKVGIFRDLVGMRLRKVPPAAIVRPKISAAKAGLEVAPGPHGSPLPCRRQRRGRDPGVDLGGQGQHRPHFRARDGD